MSITIKNLKYLLALHKTQHFGKAAGASFVSPSTFSTGISNLEKSLGVILIERDNKNVLFTPIGERIVQQARLAINEVGALIEIAHTDFFHSEITIGVIPTISTYLLPQFIANLNKHHPGLKVAFKEDTSERLIAQLEEAKIDMAIFAFPYDLPDFIDYVEVFKDPICFIRHQNRGGKIIEDGSLLMLEQGHCLRSHILQNNRILNQHIANFSCTSIDTLLAMVNIDFGVSFLPKMALDFGVLEHYPNVVTDDNCNQAKRGVGVIFRKNNPHAENIQQLAQLLK